jgi:phosphoenolpyruvate carboxykinase (ATP)
MITAESQMEYPHETGPKLHEDLTPDELVSIALSRREDSARLTASGALAVETKPDTGRSPDAKYFVTNATTADVDFGEVNKPLATESFRLLCEQVSDHFDTRDHLFQQNLSFGADPDYASNIQVVSENAWSTLFMNNLMRPHSSASERRENPYLLLHAPNMKIKGNIPGIVGDKAIVIDPESRMIVVAGTKYAGEEKKAVFTLAQFLYPKLGIATMHCSSNIDEYGNVMLYFGLSGTGKTTLSMLGDKYIINDDENGWSDKGVFGFEGGAYAKLLGLKQSKEKRIWDAVHKPGSVLENVILDSYGNPIYHAGEENMRGASSLHAYSNIEPSGMGGHPDKIFFLTADATGAMPVTARLSYHEAMYHYLSGYTSKLAGTEKGVTKPKPEFSACYGKPFLAYPPHVYAELLGRRIREQKAEVWLINTGWPGGMNNNDRLDIDLTKAVVRAIARGEVSSEYDIDGLGFAVPKGMRGIRPEQLRAETYFASIDDYYDTNRELAGQFRDNISQFSGMVTRDTLNAGPHTLAA